MPPSYSREFDPAYGFAKTLNKTPLVRRITAPNPGAYTFKGTNTYLIGRKRVGLIDPGPDDASHRDAVLAEAEREGGLVSHIILTHHHADHVEGAEAISALTGAPIFAFDADEDRAQWPFGRPNVALSDGDTLDGEDWQLEVIETPGHCSSHLCFALNASPILFSGDHLMAWSSSVIIPPDGDLASFLESLQKLKSFVQDLYLPGHGGIIQGGKAMAEAQIAHRNTRNQQILACIDRANSVPVLRRLIYPDLAPSLYGAAEATLTAHLLYLSEQGELDQSLVRPMLKSS